jgi:DNA-binding transcriptional LysR family regulator
LLLTSARAIKKESIQSGILEYRENDRGVSFLRLAVIDDRLRRSTLDESILALDCRLSNDKYGLLYLSTRGTSMARQLTADGSPKIAAAMCGPPRALVDLYVLNTFLVVSNTGNMSAAARELGLTQSAVSQQLNQLEMELKVTLLSRDRRPLQLTVAGAALRHRATRLMEDAKQLPHILQELGNQKLPNIRVGLIDSFAATAGPTLIKELLEATTQLSVRSGLSPTHGAALLQRELDMVVTSDLLEDIDGLERYPLLREPFILLAPKAQANKMKGQTFEQLTAEYPLIRYGSRSHIGAQIDRHLRRLGIHPPRTLEIDTSDTLVAIVAADVGWAITTPLCYLQGRAHFAQVSALRLPGPSVNREIVLIARAGEYAELPRRVAESACRALQPLQMRDIRSLIPWLAEEFVIGAGTQVTKSMTT